MFGLARSCVLTCKEDTLGWCLLIPTPAEVAQCQAHANLTCEVAMDMDSVERYTTVVTAADAAPVLVPAFTPGLRFYLAFSSLCIYILAAALDATSFSVVLPSKLSFHSVSLDYFRFFSRSFPKNLKIQRSRLSGVGLRFSLQALSSSRHSPLYPIPLATNPCLYRLSFCSHSVPF